MVKKFKIVRGWLEDGFRKLLLSIILLFEFLSYYLTI